LDGISTSKGSQIGHEKKKHCQLGILLVMLFATWSCVDGELYPGSGDQMVWTGDG